MRVLAWGVTLVSAVLAVLYMAIGSEFSKAATVTVFGVDVLPFDILLSCAAIIFFARWGFLRRATTPGRVAVVATTTYLAYQVSVLLPFALFVKGIEATTALRLMTPRFMVGLVVFFCLVGFRYVSARGIINLWNLMGVGIVGYALYKLARFGPVSYSSAGIIRLRMLPGVSIAAIGWLIAVSPLTLAARRRLSRYALPVLGIIGVILVNHRGAYVALATIALLHVASVRHKASAVFRLALAILTLSLVVLAVLYVQPQEVRQSASYAASTAFDPYADRSTQNRVDTIPMAVEFFVAHPMGDSIWDHPIEEGGYAEAGLPGPENFVAEILITEGIVGFAYWSLILVVTLATAWRNRSSDRVSRAMLYYLVLWLVFCLSNGAFYSLGPMCLLTVAIALVLSRDARVARSGLPAGKQLKGAMSTESGIEPPADVAHQRFDLGVPVDSTGPTENASCVTNEAAQTCWHRFRPHIAAGDRYA